MKRLIALAILFVLAMPAFGQQNKIVYDKFDWSIYHSTHFDVYFYETEKASLQRVVDTEERAYDDLSRKFNYQISNYSISRFRSHAWYEKQSRSC